MASAGSLAAQASELLDEAINATATRQAQIASELTQLTTDDFSPADANTLGRLLAKENLGARADYVKIAGFLGRADLLELLPESSKKVKAVRRARNLVLVRTGNVERRDNLLKNLRRYPVNDDFVYAVLPELVYTRDRAVFDFLWEQVISENKNCHPADAETAGRIDCAYRIVEYLGQAIEDFPVKIDEDNNLITRDYAASLAEIRRWYAAHQSDYRILLNTY